MGLTHGIMKRLPLMHPDLLQNHILPPALPEQMAVHRLGARKHPHRQRGVLHPLRLCHYVEQSHRIVSLYFTTFPLFLQCLFVYLAFAPVQLTLSQEATQIPRNVAAHTVVDIVML